MVATHELHYRAGPEALAIVRERGLRADDIRALFLPAIGPKWLVLVGLDRALLACGWLSAASRRRLLFGASIGAWRALALAARDPKHAHAALVDAYCNQRFTRSDTPAAISGAYRRMIDELFSDDDLAYALAHPHFDLAIATARARGLFASDMRLAQALAISAAACLNAVDARTQRLFFERVIFDSASGSNAPESGLRDIVGTRARLCHDNVRAVALASGTVPLYMQHVRNPAHAPAGSYLDGGFSDYHLNQCLDNGSGIDLLLLHQSRIIPSWLDKFTPFRRVAAATRSRVLLVHPSREFVRSLPGSTVPTRDDFVRFVANPAQRIARWQQVVEQSMQLGECLLADVKSGGIAARVQPF